MRAPVAARQASIESSLHHGLAAESRVYVGAPAHLFGKPHYADVAAATPMDIRLSLLQGQLSDVPHNVHPKVIQLDEGSCRVRTACYATLALRFALFGATFGTTAHARIWAGDGICL
jgi:hypothetical protein